MTVKTAFPEEIPAGLSFEALVCCADYPAPAWTLQAIIKGPQTIALDAVASGSDHLFSATSAVTGAWAPGRYWLSVRASNGTDTHEVARDQVHVLPDLSAAADGYDGRSENEIAFDAIDAVLRKRATVDQERYRINNRELWRMRVDDLLKLRSFYQMQCRREKAKRTGAIGFGRLIPVRFS